MIVKYVICSLHLFNKLCSVSFRCFTDCMHKKGKAVGMTVVVSWNNQNSSCRGKFQWNFDQGKRNVFRVSGEFELSKFELSE